MADGTRIDRLFYEIDSETQGFEQGMQSAQKSVKSFTEYVATNPGFALGAFAVAMIEVGKKATEMAAQVDAGLRKVQQAMPGTTRDLSTLRDGIAELSKVSPRAQSDLADAAAELAKLGSTDAADVMQKLAVAVEVADASGVDLHTVILGLNNVQDQFSLSTSKANAALKEMFAITQGKVDLGEVFTVLDRGGATLASLGVDATDAAKALTALVDAGVPMRQAGNVLLNIITQVDAAGKQLPSAIGDQRDALQTLVQTVTPANIATNGLSGTLANLADAAHHNARELQGMGLSLADANAVLRVAHGAIADTRSEAEKLAEAETKLKEAADLSRDSAEGLSTLLHNKLSAELIDLGNKLLPLVEAELRGLNNLLDHFGNAVQTIQGDAAQHTITNLAAALDKLTDAQRIGALERLRDAIQTVTGKNLTESGSVLGADDIAALSTQRLAALQTGLVAVQKFTTDAITMNNVVSDLIAVGAELAKRPPIPVDGPDKPKVIPPPPGPLPLTKDQLDKQRALVDQAAQALAATTSTLVDDLQAKLDQMQQAATLAFTKLGKAIPPQVKAALDAIQQEIADAKIEEPLDKSLQAIQDRIDEANLLVGQNKRSATLDASTDLAALINQQREFVSSLPAETTEHEKARAKLAQMVQLYNQLVKGSGQEENNAAQLAADRAKALQVAQAHAQVIQSAATGALQLATAFGLVDDNTAKSLTNVIQIATSIGPLIAAIKTAHDVGGIGNIIGAALPVIGGLASLASGVIGQSAQAKAYEDNQKANTEALRALTLKIGDLASSSSTGTEITKAEQVFAGISDLQLVADASLQASRGIYASFAKLGLSMQDVKDLAQSLGVTLDGSADAWIKFKQALLTADLAAYTKTFAGAMQELADSFTVFNITDPTAKLKATIKAISDPTTGVPAIAKALKGLDVGTDAGRAASITALQKLFTQLASGQISAADLGAASLGDAKQEILDLITQLRAGDGTATGTGGFNVDRTITEVTGSRLAGLLTTANVWAQATAQNTAIIAQALAGTQAPIPSIAPPAATSTVGASAGTTINLTLNVTIAGATTPSAAALIGAQLGSATVQAMNQALATTKRRQAKAVGNVVVS